MQFPAFARSEHARVVLSSLVIASYTFSPRWNCAASAAGCSARAWFAPFVPLLHSIVFLSPIPLTLLTPPGASSDGWFALFALETLLYVVGTAFIVVIMTKERDRARPQDRGDDRSADRAVQPPRVLRARRSS